MIYGFTHFADSCTIVSEVEKKFTEREREGRTRHTRARATFSITFSKQTHARARAHVRTHTNTQTQARLDMLMHVARTQPHSEEPISIGYPSRLLPRGATTTRETESPTA